MTEQREFQLGSNQTAALEDLTLAGPIFETEPGWGGKLSAWFKRSIFSVLLVSAILVLGISLAFYLTKESSPTSQDKNLAPNLSYETFKQTAQKGQGVTHLARQATAEYLTINQLDWITPEHKIFVEDYLKDKVGAKNLEIGEIVEFSSTDVRNGIERAQKLKPEELKNLTKYVKGVDIK